MKCQELLKMLNDYVDGDIDVGVCGEFERHLAGCNPCKIVVDTIRKTITLYKGEEVYELPADFQARLRNSLRREWDERAAEDPDAEASAPGGTSRAD
jgi:anti-sigma factor RsiW